MPITFEQKLKLVVIALMKMDAADPARTDKIMLALAQVGLSENPAAELREIVSEAGRMDIFTN